MSKTIESILMKLGLFLKLKYTHLNEKVSSQYDLFPEKYVTPTYILNKMITSIFNSVIKVNSHLKLTLVRIIIMIKLINAAVMEVNIFACLFKKNPLPP